MFLWIIVPTTCFCEELFCGEIKRYLSGYSSDLELRIFSRHDYQHMSTIIIMHGRKPLLYALNLLSSGTHEMEMCLRACVIYTYTDILADLLSHQGFCCQLIHSIVFNDSISGSQMSSSNFTDAQCWFRPLPCAYVKVYIFSQFVANNLKNRQFFYNLKWSSPSTWLALW